MEHSLGCWELLLEPSRAQFLAPIVPLCGGEVLGPGGAEVKESEASSSGREGRSSGASSGSKKDA